MKKNFSKLCISFFLIFSSCSLKYGGNVNTEDTTPEFIFSNANFTRYEENKKTMEMTAEQIEQYKDGFSTYAKDIDFSIYNKDGELETEGSCNYLGANTDTKIYEFYSDIKINNIKDKSQVSAKNLKWNGKTEQLTSDRNDVIKIEQDGTLIMGSGFSASGINKTFAFTGVVTGEIEAADKNQEETETSETVLQEDLSE